MSDKKGEPILSPMMVDLIASAPSARLPLPPLRLRDCCKDATARAEKAEAEVARLRGALVEVTEENCCGCSAYARIAQAALDGES